MSVMDLDVDAISDDDCYLDNSDDDRYPDDGDDNYCPDDCGDDDVLPNDRKTSKDHTVLSKDEIRHRQNHDISEVTSLLSVSRDEAIILLRHCKWTVDNVFAVSLDDETRKSLGLSSTSPLNPNPNRSSSLICSICFELYPQADFFAAACGHPFCRHCWAGYMKSYIGDGPGCLSLRCPYPKCRISVGESMINLLAEEEDKTRFSDCLLRSYVENSRVIKWCPAPGCDLAIEFDYGSSDVTCLCSNQFCWKCGEDAHRPVDCSTVEKWMIKNGNEGENTTWILVNCKPCPKCRRNIEKNEGCMHMTCFRGCGFEFCWLCLREWSKHGSQTGGYYACNTYKSEVEKGLHKLEEEKRRKAKESLNRYTHYYERWLSNHNSRKKAISDLREMESEMIKILSDKYKEPESMLRWVIKAWEQIVECRRVLKWSYAYGFYNCNEDTEEEKHKKEFFEYAQGEAEHWLERLHECAEKEIKNYLKDIDDATPELGFDGYKHKLTALTKATRGYFEELVKGLENDGMLLDI